jgi:hypothetical protein
LSFALFVLLLYFIHEVADKECLSQPDDVYLVLIMSVQVRRKYIHHLHSKKIRGFQDVGFRKKRSTQPTKNDQILKTRTENITNEN